MKLKSASIKTRLLLMVAILIFLSVSLVTVTTYQNYRKDLINLSSENTGIIMEQLLLNMDTYIYDLKRLCYYPLYVKEVMYELETLPQTPQQVLSRQRMLESFLGSVLTMPRQDVARAYILSDAVYSSKKTQYDAHIPSDFRSESWYTSAVASTEPVIIPTYSEQHGRSVQSFFSVVFRLNAPSDGRELGVIRIDANYNGMEALFSKVAAQEGNHLIVMDTSGNLIYRSDEGISDAEIEEVGSLILSHADERSFIARVSDRDYSLSYRVMSSAPWVIVDLHSMKAILSTAESVRFKSMLLAVLFAAIGFILSIVLVGSFLKPVFDITALMKKVQQGDFSVKASVKGDDELSFLAASFNEMVSRLNAAIDRNNLLTRQVYEAKYLEKQAQFTALCNQIRPHFLFNSLNTISLLVKCQRNMEAVQCIEMLATLLEAMVNSDQQISLQRELSIVGSYLTLQQKRYGNLEYTIEASDELKKSIHLPALIIQPLVENALVHGCEPKRGTRKVEIVVSSSGDVATIVVRDNGVGMDGDSLSRLRKRLGLDTDAIEREESDGHGIGMLNICRRIKLKYGYDYGVQVDSVEGSGTTVTVTLPIED